MSDHGSGVSPRDEQAETEVAEAFSSNGSDPDGRSRESDSYASGKPDDGTTFLADLAKAMQSTAAAEQARNTEVTEQRRQAHVDAIRAREAIEAEDLRELAKDDVKGIDSWSDGEIKRIKLERERRIAARREQLHLRLEEHRTVVAREVEAVETAVATYRTEIEQFFRRLEWETDPVAIARQAGTRPVFPVLELIGPDEVPSAADRSDTASEVPAAIAETEPEAPDAIAVAEDQPVEASENAEATASDETTTPTADDLPVDPVIGAATTDANARPAATPWRSETDAFMPTSDPVVDAGEDEATNTEASDESATEAVQAETETEGTERAIPLSDGSDETIEEAAEAMAAMPRSTSAGSWLRWPNASADRSDTER